MAKRGRKRAPPKPSAKPKDAAEERFADLQRAFNDQEVERRAAAVQAIQAAEIESLLSRLRLLRSYLSKEQLETHALAFFQENLPNLSVVRNEKHKVYELEWKDKNSAQLGNRGNGLTINASLDNATAAQPRQGLPFSAKSVTDNFLEAANFCFALDEPTNQILGTRDAFQTPGDTSNRLSFGMTPKTLRLPKHGEMLLSVQGSPLGVYKEENLEAIDESGEGAC